MFLSGPANNDNPGKKARAPIKRHAQPESRDDYHKKYDKARKRIYNPDWEKLYKWLKYTPGVPTCTSSTTSSGSVPSTSKLT